MSFLDDVGKKLSDQTKKVAQKSGQVYETGKANIEILREEENIRRMYAKIGEAVYYQYETGKPMDSSVKELCEQTSEIKRKIKDLKDKIEDLKSKDNIAIEQNTVDSNDNTENNVIFCPNCGAKCEKGFNFCYNCGSKLDI